ncbi:hypothetical protein C8J57DRAFT_72431 [Mycena rebaudengoi]|nr:hypothetical protein C8J57DRAFT_72431 [Mycena rebaudengoi]
MSSHQRTQGTARASERDGRAAGGTESQWWEAAPTDGVAPVGDAAAIPGDRKCAFGETCGLLSGRRSERVHAHPSQSCSMCSVDLHTHASFRCMLPESFAVTSLVEGIFACLHMYEMKASLQCV